VISDAPIAVADAAPGGVLTKIDAFISAARSAAAGGITWSEFGELLVALLRLAVSSLDAIASMTGAEKKAVAIDAAGRLFDALAGLCSPLFVWPVWALFRGPVRLLVLALASGAIEQLLPLVRRA
jgi:hypothetical protein